MDNLLTMVGAMCDKLHHSSALPHVTLTARINRAPSHQLERCGWTELVNDSWFAQRPV